MSTAFVVDDNIVARSMLVRMLTEEGLDIVGESGTGQGAIIMMEELKPDIVMLEADLDGGMNIEDVIKEIKKSSPNTKVIICSDGLSRPKIMEAVNYGMDDFIMKPYRKAALVRVVRKVLSEK